MNRWHTDRAISLAMEKVVVVVVVTIRLGSLGSGMRLDCENFKDPKLLIASSEANEKGKLLKRKRCVDSGKLTIKVEKRSLKSYTGCSHVSLPSQRNKAGPIKHMLDNNPQEHIPE
jgi:hypothetical protein